MAKQKVANPNLEISRTPVNSSTIKSLGYSKKQQTLEIEFHVRKKQPPVVWRYYPISPLAFKQLSEAKSVGSHFATYIKNNQLITSEKMSG